MKYSEILLLLTLLFFTGCAADNDSRPGAVNEVTTEFGAEMLLENTTRELISLWNNGDTSAALEYYRPDASLITPGGKTLTGKSAIGGFSGRPVAAADLRLERAAATPTLVHLWMRAPANTDTSAMDTSSVNLFLLFQKNEETDWKLALEVWR